jgi:hypothetical protein
VEARLAPGKRHTEPLRRFYLDEDTWIALLSESYDNQMNFWKWGWNGVMSFPQLPALRVVASVTYNMQQQIYVFNGSFPSAPPNCGTFNFDPFPMALLNPQSMADSGGL